LLVRTSGRTDLAWPRAQPTTRQNEVPSAAAWRHLPGFGGKVQVHQL